MAHIAHLLKSRSMKRILTLALLLALADSHATAQTEPEQYFLRNDDPKEWAEKLAQMQGADFDAGLTLPYPLIFIHGLVGDRASWQEMWNFLAPAFTYGGELAYCLNSDGDLTYSNISSTATSDISQFVTSSQQVKPGDYYLLNFDVSPDGTSHGSGGTNEVQSNQAAIVKQGVALSHAIKAVLSLTGRKKVVLVGHSMGGLCARMYLQTPGLWTKPNVEHQVAKLVTSGTPHGGSNLTAAGIGGWFANFAERSDAVRDLRTSYAVSGNAGVFLFGGQESLSVMNNNVLWDYHNADVNCNGVAGNSFTGLNQRTIPTDLDYTCIVGNYLGFDDDGVVDGPKADLKNYYPGTHMEKVISTASHTALPGDIQANTIGLDEPDDYHLAYGIERNREYRGFLTVQDKAVTYADDFDDYRFTMPQPGFVKALAWSLPPSACLMNIVRASDETILAQTLSGGASQMSTSLTWLPAGDYFFEMAATPPNPTYWNKVYSFRLEHNASSPVAEAIPGTHVEIGPNPTTGPLSVTLNSEQPAEGVLSVLDFAGRTLHTLAVSSAGTYPLDLGSHAAGLYIVTLRTADGVGAWTVVKN